MPWPEDEKQRKRFYLLPGMGGRAARRKRMTVLRWTLLAGILVSAALAGILYLINSYQR